MKVTYEMDDANDAPNMFEYMYKAEQSYSMLEKLREKIFYILEHDRIIDAATLEEFRNLINEVLE